jgi:Tfp pilus assembly protein PilF
MVAETWDLGEQTPPDPSGLFGYFIVAVNNGDAQKPSALFDPWGGRRDVTAPSVRVLRDTEAIAAGLGTDAMRIFAKSGDSSKALPLVETALLLDPVSPSLRGVQGTVLMETGGVAIGAKELEAALQLRPDGPRQLNVVQLLLAKAAMLQMAGEAAAAEAELNAASRSISAVVTTWPRYSRAHLVLAMLHFGIDEPERARVELEIAEELDPTSASLSALWGQYYLSQEDYVSAAARVKRAVELDPDNWQLRLQVARVLLEAGDEEGARVNVKAALDLVPAAKRDELKQYLARALGAGVLGEEAPSVLPSALPSGGLVLPEPSVGGSNLRLRDLDQDLQLDLDD